MHFDVGQEPAGVSDRLILFERLVGECETSGGELLSVQVKRARSAGVSRAGTHDTSVAHLWLGSRLDYPS